MVEIRIEVACFSHQVRLFDKPGRREEIKTNTGRREIEGTDGNAKIPDPITVIVDHIKYVIQGLDRTNMRIFP